jgi:hypothetical protein
VVTCIRTRRVTIASHRGIVSGLGIYMDWINKKLCVHSSSCIMRRRRWYDDDVDMMVVQPAPRTNPLLQLRVLDYYGKTLLGGMKLRLFYFLLSSQLVESTCNPKTMNICPLTYIQIERLSGHKTRSSSHYTEKNYTVMYSNVTIISNFFDTNRRVCMCGARSGRRRAVDIIA